MSRRCLRFILVLALLAPALLQRPDVLAQGDATQVEASTLEGFRYQVEQHYAAPAFLAESPPDVSAYEGPIRLVVTVSRFDKVANARAAYDAVTADWALTLADNGEGMRMLDIHSENIDDLGATAHAVTSTVVFDDGPTMHVRYLVVQSADLLFETVALAAGEEHLAVMEGIIAVMLEREVQAEPAAGDGPEGLVALLPENDDPMLDGLVKWIRSEQSGDGGE